MCGGGGGGIFFFQAEDGIRDLVRSRGLGDVYKRQIYYNDYDDLQVSQIRPGIVFTDILNAGTAVTKGAEIEITGQVTDRLSTRLFYSYICLLYTSDAADERSSVDLGGRRIIKKKKKEQRI